VFNAMQQNLKVCCSLQRRHQTSQPGFCINGQSIDYVGKYVHLGHVISADLNDKDITERCRSALVGQINNVICFFGKLDHVIKMEILISYCYSLYGCVLWNLTFCNIYSTMPRQCL